MVSFITLEVKLNMIADKDCLLEPNTVLSTFCLWWSFVIRAVVVLATPRFFTLSSLLKFSVPGKFEGNKNGSLLKEFDFTTFFKVWLSIKSWLDFHTCPAAHQINKRSCKDPEFCCCCCCCCCGEELLLEFGQDRYREKSTDVSFRI